MCYYSNLNKTTGSWEAARLPAMRAGNKKVSRMNAPPPRPSASTLAIPIGVILTCKQPTNAWADPVWRASGVMLDIPPGPEWRELARGEGVTQYLTTRAQLELFRKETEAYIANIESTEPALYMVLRDGETDDAPVEVHLVTASPFEAQDYMDSSEETVERVSMPAPLLEMIAGFIEEHHVEETFRKRKRDEVDITEEKFGQEPIFVTRERRKKNGQTP